jgi:hypothetical protein
MEKNHYLLEYVLVEAFFKAHSIDLLNDLMTHHIIFTMGGVQQHVFALGIYFLI